jgi:hypothetical protein
MGQVMRTHTDYPASGIITYQSCFISPYGTYYPVEYGSHCVFAREHSMDDTDPIGDLERKGWVHISLEAGYAGVYTGTSSYSSRTWSYRSDVTQAQVDVLFAMLMDAPASERILFLTSVRRYVPDFGVTD